MKSVLLLVGLTCLVIGIAVGEDCTATIACDACLKQDSTCKFCKVTETALAGACQKDDCSDKKLQLVATDNVKCKDLNVAAKKDTCGAGEVACLDKAGGANYCIRVTGKTCADLKMTDPPKVTCDETKKCEECKDPCNFCPVEKDVKAGTCVDKCADDIIKPISECELATIGKLQKGGKCGEMEKVCVSKADSTKKYCVVLAGKECSDYGLKADETVGKDCAATTACGDCLKKDSTCKFCKVTETALAGACQKDDCSDKKLQLVATDNVKCKDLNVAAKKEKCEAGEVACLDKAGGANYCIKVTGKTCADLKMTNPPKVTCDAKKKCAECEKPCNFCPVEKEAKAGTCVDNCADGITPIVTAQCSTAVIGKPTADGKCTGTDKVCLSRTDTKKKYCVAVAENKTCSDYGLKEKDGGEGCDISKACGMCDDWCTFCPVEKDFKVGSCAALCGTGIDALDTEEKCRDTMIGVEMSANGTCGEKQKECLSREDSNKKFCVSLPEGKTCSDVGLTDSTSSDCPAFDDCETCGTKDTCHYCGVEKASKLGSCTGKATNCDSLKLGSTAFTEVSDCTGFHSIDVNASEGDCDKNKCYDDEANFVCSKEECSTVGMLDVAPTEPEDPTDETTQGATTVDEQQTDGAFAVGPSSVVCVAAGMSLVISSWM